MPLRCEGRFPPGRRHKSAPLSLPDQQPSHSCHPVRLGALAIMPLPDPKTPSETISDWVCREILPHEREVRRWLQRSRLPVDIDDVIQEAYARVAALDSVAHILNGRAYFLTAARSIALQHLRRSKVIRMDSFTDLPPQHLEDDRPGTEAEVWSRMEMQRLLQLLPDRCRAIFQLCRVKGYTQKETAEALGLTENVVEKQIARAMELLIARYGRDGGL